jgi:hypothetical protein
MLFVLVKAKLAIMLRPIIFTGILFLLALPASAQVNEDPEKIGYKTEDSIFYSSVYQLKPVLVIDHHFDDPADRSKFRRAKYYVLKMYPYAMEALAVMAETDSTLASMEKKRKQNRYLRREHKELKGEYKDMLKDFTVEEGRTLVKIIERETGEPLYDIVKRYKNGLTATYFEKMANMYGYSLKDGYDPEKEKFIEIVVQALEAAEEPIEYPVMDTVDTVDTTQP